jgi:hypothetical protein
MFNVVYLRLTVGVYRFDLLTGTVVRTIVSILVPGSNTVCL